MSSNFICQTGGRHVALGESTARRFWRTLKKKTHLVQLKKHLFLAKKTPKTHFLKELFPPQKTDLFWSLDIAAGRWTTRPRLGIVSMVSLQSVEVFFVECVSHERRRRPSPQTSARQTLHPEYRQSSTGSVAVASTCATTPLSSFKHNTKQVALGLGTGHSGASRDHLTKSRSLTEVRKTAFWQCQASVNCHEKSWAANRGQRFSCRGVRPWRFVGSKKPIVECTDKILPEAYGGKGQVARCFRKFGLPTYVFDSRYGQRYDWQSRRRLAPTLRDINLEQCVAGMLSPPHSNARALWTAQAHKSCNSTVIKMGPLDSTL